VYPLQVEGGGDQAPFAFDSLKATEQELTEAHHLLYNPEGGFYGRLAPAIELSPLGRLEAVFQVRSCPPGIGSPAGSKSVRFRCPKLNRPGFSGGSFI
jgi:hypothetical protein